MRADCISPGARKTDGTTGQIERRVARILRGAGGAGVSRGADLSCAVLRKKIQCSANYESSGGAAGAARERSARHAAGSEAAICVGGRVSAVFVRAAAGRGPG